MKNNKHDQDLIDAVLNNDVSRVQRLLEEGADPNQTDDDASVTPLHYAAQYNTLEIAKLLIAAGADLLAETDDEQTPMQIAKLYGHVEMVELFSNAYFLN